MAVTDFVRRSMQIVAGGIAQSTTDYFDNAITFVNDVKEVMDMGKQMGSDGAKKFNELRQAGIFKKARDWFYNEGGMFGDFDFDDEDFDGGFEIESADDENSKKESEQPLSKKMMTDIAKKQTGAMYKAFGKQADLQIANTAEIVSTINTRTAELTASVNNVNNTLIQIGKRLDLIVEWTSARTKKEEEDARKASILDYGGGISLSGVINKAKENAEDSMLATFMSMGKTMLGSGMMTPEMVASMIFSQTILDKKWKKLDNKSINEIGEFINDTIGEVIQNSLTKVLTSKNEFLSGIFEDIIRGPGSKNYQNSAVNAYNDKPAIFDGMTRKSIITVIPGYLNEILKAVNGGHGMNVDKKGNLTHAKSNAFITQVSDSYFRAGTVGYKERENIQTRTQLSSKEITDAIRTMTGVWVWVMYGTGMNILEKGETQDLNSPRTRIVLARTAQLLASKTKYSESQWLNDLLPGIISEIDETKYRMELQRANQRADNDLETFAKSNVNNHQAKRIDWGLLKQAFENNWKDFDSKSIDPDASQIGSGSKYITQMDITKGILDKLNKGINVFVTGSSNKRKKQYGMVNVKPGYFKQHQHTPPQEDSNQMEDFKNLVNGPHGADKLTGEAAELRRRKDNGETLSRAEERILKDAEDEAGLTLKGKLKQKREQLREHFSKEQRNGIIQDPETAEWLYDLLPERFRNWLERTKETETYQNVSKSKPVQGAKNILGSAKDAIGDTLFGERSTDENGNEIRTGGLLHKGFTKGAEISDKLSSAKGSMTRTKTLQKRFQDLSDKYTKSMPDVNDKDTMRMQMIIGSINTALADGKASTMDLQALNTEISKLDDRELQRELKQTVIPLIKRNAKLDTTNASNASSGKKGESTLGMLGKMAVGAAKLIVKPLLVYLKYTVGLALTFFKWGAGKLMKFAKWGITSGLRDLKSGMKSFISGMSKLFKPVFKVVNVAVKGVYTFTSKLAKGIKGITGWLATGIKKLFTRKQNQNNQTKPDQPKKQGVLTRLGNRIKNTSFAQGFMKSYNERKQAQREASLKEKAEPIERGIKDALGESNGKKGPLSALLDVVNKIFNKIPEQAEDESKKDENKPQMEDVYEEQNKNKENKPQDQSQQGDSETGGGSGGGGIKGRIKGVLSGAKNGIGGMLKGIGEAVGGMTGMLMGIGKIILTIVTSLEGFKALTKIVTTILTESLKPLNQAFQAVIKAVKPILKQLGGLIKQIAKFVVEIVEIVIDVIKPILEDVVKPILEVLSPLLEAILGAITPILKIVGILLKVIMAPLMGLFKFVLLPILKIIGDAVQIIMGVLQIGFGLIMCAIGAVVTALGTVISAVGLLIPGAKKLGKGIKDSGKGMLTQGEEFVVQGGKSVAQGFINIVLDTGNLLTMGAVDEATSEPEQKKETKQIQAVDEDTVKKTVANGDLYNTYGGEYQRGMGGYLNMNQRGCGPIALADMYNRRGGAMGARSLAGMMYNDGTYDPRRGTSVGGYIDSARSLGMNLRPGGVTQQSLKYASPNNPITVVGSGSDYGTRNGNNHFMNVIGTDHHGGAYVSNPLTGRIDRRPASTVAGSAVMGLYAGGDNDDIGGYTFPDAIKEAFRKLKAQANQILGMFSMDKSDDEEVNEIITAEQNNAALESAKKNMTKEEYAKFESAAEALALDDYKKLYPQRDGQSDEDYQAAFKEWYAKHSAEYLAKAKVEDMTLTEAANKGQASFWDEMASKSDDFVTGYIKKLKDVGTAADNAESDMEGLEKGGDGSFTSDEGVPLYTPYDIEITETDITKTPYNSPLFEFFAKMMGKKVGDVYGSGWFKKYNDPNKEGEGQTDAYDENGNPLPHHGVDFTGPDIGGQPVYATTGGTVISNKPPEASGGGGNMVVWQDEAGKYHWYMHMKERSLLSEGAKIKGGDLIGYIGSTGQSTGDHLHYTINTDKSYSGNGKVWNPLMYFSNYNPTYGDLVGDTDEEKIWAFLRNNGFEPHAAAGLMGNFQHESGNNPSTVEGYGAFDGWGNHDGPTVKAALKDQASLDDYVVNKLFPMYAAQGTGLDYPAYEFEGHYYPGMGLAQWTGSRTVALSKYTVGKNLPWSDLGGQLDYTKHEFDDVSRYKNALTAANNSNDPAEAARIFLDDFECNPGAALSERQSYARQFLEKYKNWTAGSSKAKKNSSDSAITFDDQAAAYDNYQQIKSADGKNTGTVVAEGGLNLRAGIGTGTQSLMLIPNGTSLNLEVSGDAGWYKTTYAGKTGYVSSAYIKLDKTGEPVLPPSGSGSSTWDYNGIIDAYDKANQTRGKAPGATSLDVSKAFVSDLMASGWTWEDIVKAGDELYTGNEYEYGGPAKLWLWARENTNTDFNNIGATTFSGYNLPGMTVSGPQQYSAGTHSSSTSYGPQPYTGQRASSSGTVAGPQTHSGTTTTNNNSSNSKIWGPNEASWKADWYKDSKNAKYFLNANNSGPLMGGKFYDLQHMAGLIFANNRKNKYADNLRAEYGSDDAYTVMNNMYKEAYSAQDWYNLRYKYHLKGKEKTKLPDNLENVHIAMYGYGDPNDTSDMDFWNSYMNWNNSYAGSNITTPGDDYLGYNQYYDEATGSMVVNNYSIKRGEDTVTNARIQALLYNTYNVRSESMEAILAAILEELRRRKDPNGTGGNTNGSTKLFDERIPSQVTRLSVG